MQTREYRHLIEIETLFWINKPEGEEFIKSSLTELIKKKLAEEKIFPPVPELLRRDFLEQRK